MHAPAMPTIQRPAGQSSTSADAFLARSFCDCVSVAPIAIFTAEYASPV